MAAYIKPLENENGDLIYPQTKINGVFDESGDGLQNILENKATVIISSTQPTTLKVGDYWYKIL